MALAGSAWKHVSSSGVSTRLGARPAHAPDFGRRDASLLSRRRARPSVARARSSDHPRRIGRSASVVSRRNSTSDPWRVSERARSSVWLVPREARGLVALLPQPPPPLSLYTRHRMRQDYPLNLSISLSGGEETNQDAPSNGE